MAKLLCMISAAATAAAAWAAQPIKLLPLGDSITWGVGSTSVPPDFVAVETISDGGYRGPLYHALVNSHVDNTSFQFVGSQSSGPLDVPVSQHAHEGHPGWTSGQLLGIAKNWSAYAADIVMLHAGTNDIHMQVPLPTIVSNLNGILNASFTANPSAQVLMAAILMRGEPQWVAPVNALNAALPALAAQWTGAGYSAIVVDIANRTSMCALGAGMGQVNRSDCCQDRVHPTAGGYSVMAGVWWEYLRPLLPTTTSTTLF